MNIYRMGPAGDFVDDESIEKVKEQLIVFINVGIKDSNVVAIGVFAGGNRELNIPVFDGVLDAEHLRLEDGVSLRNSCLGAFEMIGGRGVFVFFEMLDVILDGPHNRGHPGINQRNEPFPVDGEELLHE